MPYQLFIPFPHSPRCPWCSTVLQWESIVIISHVPFCRVCFFRERVEQLAYLAGVVARHASYDYASARMDLVWYCPHTVPSNHDNKAIRYTMAQRVAQLDQPPWDT
jgi:hypothetical protein